MNSAHGGSERSPSSLTTSHPCRLFSLAEIQSATNNFDDDRIIGEGGFGKVYKGYISTEQVVAIKRLDSMSNQGEVEFRAEIDMLSKLRHCNLVSLIGYCNDHKEMILVYDYMPNGTLYYHLHKGSAVLSWVRRLKIAIGAARGLDYLHTGVGTQHGVIHRDIKTSNILLDENWNAMISDFGLSKIGPTNQVISYVDASVKGTFGYLDPEYFYTRKLTRKTDVYSFGVVLFELLSGRLPVDERYGEEQCSLVRWAQKCVQERKLDQMVDPNIKGTIYPKCLKRFAQIAFRCVQSIPKERPTMTELVASLQGLLELHEKSKNSDPLSAGMGGFNRKFLKYFVSATEPNAGGQGSQGVRGQTSQGGRTQSYHGPSGLRIETSGSNKSKDLSGTSLPKLEELVTRHITFTYDELKLATRNFVDDTFLGEGTYGEVYKGWVNENTYSPSGDDHNGLPIAVKKLHRYKLFDVNILKKFHHPNFVKLIGYCLEGKHELFLVYEFMHKGNFADLLHYGALARLPLATKVRIIVGIARGIVFLQKQELNGTYPGVSMATLYRHKILLDEDFTPKLSGYDVGILVDGTYISPFSDLDGGLVPQCNISGYELLFIEILTGKQIYRLGGANESLRHTARLCFDICNEVDSESKMITILKELKFEDMIE